MCKQMINPTPAAGAVDRHPPARLCTTRVWRDDFCKKHHPETVEKKARSNAERELNREERDIEKKEMREHQTKLNRARQLIDLDKLTEEKCVMFLLSKGYTLAKQQ